MKSSTIESWEDVERVLGEQPLGTLLRLPRGWLAHPTAHGMRSVASPPEGQLADYCKRLTAGGRLYVREFRNWYEVHREPPVATHGPTSEGGDQAIARNGVALGASMGGALGKTEAAFMVGALLGGLAAAMALAAAEDQKRRRIKR